MNVLDMGVGGTAIVNEELAKVIKERDALNAYIVDLQSQRDYQGLTLASLCAMVFGDDANCDQDNDAALIRRVGLALRVVQAARNWNNRVPNKIKSDWNLVHALAAYDAATKAK